MTINKKYNHLKSIAKLSVKLQAISAIIFIIIFSLSVNSNTIAVICGYASVLISLSPIFYALWKKDFTLVFSCISLYTISPIWFLYLEAILPGYDAYVYITPEYRILALFWVAVFQLILNSLYIVFWSKITKQSISFFRFLPGLNISPNAFIISTFFAFLIPLLALALFYGSIDVLWGALTEGRSGGGGSGILKRNAVGDESALLLPLTWIWQLVPLLGSISYVNGKSKHKITASLALLAGLLVIFITFLGGSRAGMIFVAAPALFFLFYYNWNKGLKFWVPAAMLAITSIGIMELQVRFRGNLLQVLSDPVAAAKSRGLTSVTTFDVSESHRDNNMYLLCLMVKSYPEKYSFEGFNDFFAVLVNPIPRAIWPGKPVFGAAADFSTLRAYIAEGPRKMGTTSLSVSIVGNAYIAYGVLGFLVYSFVYAFFLLWFDGLLYYTQKKSALEVGIYGIGIFLSFWGFRDFFALVSFIYPVLLLIFVLKFISIKSR